MGSQKGLRPEDAGDAAEFVALMRRAKERSGLTYRELEQRAARHGDVLARSTLANALARHALPRPDLVAAFVRACEGEDQVERWLAARDRLAEAAPRTAAPEAPAAPRTAGALAARWFTGPGRVRRVTGMTAVGLAVATAAVLALSFPGDDDRAQRGEPVGADGPVRIRPVLSPGLCLTDGHTRDGRYPSEVAVHRPCAGAEPPVTRLVPAGNGTYRVSWYHPEHGTGCLVVLTTAPARDLLEPRNDCTAGTRFRVERVHGGDGADTDADEYVLRVDAGRCLGAADAEPAEGTEAVVRACTDAPAQRYLIGPSDG
ncbi:hypothetical protein GCM10010451_60000 [Streptomyces virens]|uniref:Uncharacterized protein n=3 Tax=Streptomyces TaxID=1883 RepID=A0A514JRJ4_9ACTN|nr:XRE family transcriptional regulator [Streptomyces calvus]MBA8977226.1 hypothetical protein [Streptomyces calvus]QDI69945.1 hypothetical protein CD934_15500 [Streptomyces calvus]